MLNALGLCRKAPAAASRPAESEGNAREESLSSAGGSQHREERKSYMTYPCPFCGQAVLTFVRQTLATGGRHDGEHLTLCCEYCGARGPLADTHEECAEKWNRPSLKYNELMEQVEKVEQERDLLKRELKRPKEDSLDALIREHFKNDYGWKTLEWSSRPKARPWRPSRVGSGCRRR